MPRLETLTPGHGPPSFEPAPGVEIRMLANGSLGAKGLTTALARFHAIAELPYHTHPCSEVIIALEGQAEVLVEGRQYLLKQFDAIHIPAQVAHSVRNISGTNEALLHSSFATEMPTRIPVLTSFKLTDGAASTGPEKIIRFHEAHRYELSSGTSFRDLFARRFGAQGICGGYGLFEPGASLPCHYHGFDESITIVAGTAMCQVAGQEYEAAHYDTVCIPEGRPHRFLNRSDKPMAMIWVYAGDEPDRTLVDPGYCDGRLPT